MRPLYLKEVTVCHTTATVKEFNFRHVFKAKQSTIFQVHRFVLKTHLL